MDFIRAFTFALVLVTGVGAFAPANKLKSNNVRSTSNLQMSAALIVQNKGGGHGELGKFPGINFSIALALRQLINSSDFH